MKWLPQAEGHLPATTGGDSPQTTVASQSQATVAMPELYERLAPAIVQVAIYPHSAAAAATPARE
jgi:hypothetical protein